MSQKYRVDTDHGSFIVETEDSAAPAANPNAAILAKQAAQFPTAAEHEATLQKRSGLQVAQDQTKNMLEGAASAVTGIPGAVYDLAHSFNPNPDPGEPSFKDKASSLYHSVADPIGTVARSIGNAAAPEYISPPTDTALEGAARSGGALVGALAAPKIASKMPALPEADALQTMAQKAKAYRQANPIGEAMGNIDITKPTSTGPVQAVKSAAAGTAGYGLEKLARLRAAMDKPPADVQTPAVAPSPIPAPQLQPLADQMARAQSFDNTPQLDMRQSSGSSAPIPAPQLQPLADQMARAQSFDNTPQLDMRQPAGPSAPIPAPQLQPLADQMAQSDTPQFDMRQSSGPSAPIPAPELQPLADQMAQPQAPMEHPIQQLTPEEHGILNGIFREGKGAPTSVKNVNLAIQNAPYLMDVIPELKGTPPGAQFDAKLFNGFQRIGHELSAAESSIPDSTPVVTADAVKKLGAMEQEAASSMQNDAVRAIAKVKEKLEERPTMTWDDFIKAKRSFDNEVGVDSVTGSKIYQVFKEMSNSVSPELGKLNQQYYTARTAIDLAKMNTFKGLRLAEVAAKAKGLRPKGLPR